MSQPFCEAEGRFLADRYVGGSCPYCKFDGAKGDQCDNCGRTLDPEELVGMICLLCGSVPIFRDTEHFFFRLTAFEDRLKKWVASQSHWRPNVQNLSMGFLEGGLRNTAITRDIDWGIRIPIEGYEDKRIYVWFEAVIGYLSASVEWAKSTGHESKWKEFWQEPCRMYYFMGKDNIPFHTIRWPAMLLGYEGLNLPYDVPSNEYLQLEGLKLSTSRNWAVWLPDYLDRFDPDPLRYAISANMPETSDSDFSWQEYVRRNNDELVATYGNLVHRILTMVHQNFNGEVPRPSSLDEIDLELLQHASDGLADTGENIEQCRFRAGIESAMGLAKQANRYLDRKAPWREIRRDRNRCASTLWVGLAVINCLKIAMYPYLPFSSEKLHRMLGFQDEISDNGWFWDQNMLEHGRMLHIPQPLFSKLDDAVIDRETERIGT
jgi:methionyl-tRNA synthetase